MDVRPDKEKLDALEAKVQQAQASSSKTNQDTDLSSKGNNIGYDFIAAVLSCTFLGWLIDQGMNTKPWGLIVMLFVGFALGMIKIWRSLAPPQD